MSAEQLLDIFADKPLLKCRIALSSYPYWTQGAPTTEVVGVQNEVVASRSSSVGASPKVVVVVAPKGGVGKTTIVMTLLVSARRAGLSVLGVNMDSQRSLESWAVRRGRMIDENPSSAIPEIPVKRLEPGEWRKLQTIIGCDIVIVDTPPGHGEALHSIRSVCELADLVLVPTSSSGLDLEEIVPFGKGIVASKVFFVLNRVNRRTRSWAQAKTDLTRGTRLAPSDIPMLEAIPTQYVSGLATTDYGDPGSQAFEALWNFVRVEAGLRAEEHANG